MLNTETKEKLQGLGFDVSKLEEAVRSESETGLDVPTLKKESDLKDWISPEQKETFGKNRFEEGKKAMSEIKAKDVKSKFGIEMDSKNLDEVISAIVEQETKKAANGNAEWMEEKKTLQSKIQELSTEKESMQSDFQQKLFNFEVRKDVLSSIPENTILGKDDIAALFFNEYTVKKGENGSSIVVYDKTGKKLKDQVENPLPLADVVKSFLDQKKFVQSGGGMGGDDKNPGGSPNKFKSTEEFMTWAKNNNIEPMSAEGQKILKDNKAEDFTF